MTWRRAATSLGFAVAAAILLAPTASAQPPIPWWENPIAAGLNLTDAQRSRVNEIAREFRERLIERREETNRAELEFEDVFNAEVVDPQRGRAAIERLAKARADLTRDLSEMTLQMRAVLTTSQWRELQSRRPDFDAGRGPKGPGKEFRPPPRSGSFTKTGAN